jgi:hypothetical protein
LQVEIIKAAEVKMEKLVRCKACGFVTTENKLKDTCPACGVPSKAFEEFKSPLSDRRRKLLSLEGHPILVHFPQSFAPVILFLLIVSLLPVPFKSEFLTSAIVLIYLLPFGVIAAIVTGLIDGKTRFKKLNTEILKRKISIGSLLLVLSLANTALVFYKGFDNAFLPIIAVSFACVICEIFIGNLGGSIMESKLPG